MFNVKLQYVSLSLSKQNHLQEWQIFRHRSQCSEMSVASFRLVYMYSIYSISFSLSHDTYYYC